MADVPFRERIFCTINEAAQATGSGRSKVYELIKAERIRTVRIDGRTKVVVASLLELGGSLVPISGPLTPRRRGAQKADEAAAS